MFINLFKPLAHAFAIFLLLLQPAIGAEADSERDKDLIVQKAEQGDAEAQYELGIAYFNGDLFPRDQKAAFHWLTKSSEQGYARAHASLTLFYQYGLVVEKDLKMTINLLLKAAEKGIAGSMSSLSYIYRTGGDGVPVDLIESAKWELKHAEKTNDSLSQYSVGYNYEKGNGVIQDYEEALKWYLKSAKQGELVALSVIGDFFAEGKGVTKDLREAAKWYQKGAEAGIQTCQVSLGLAFWSGKGVIQDYASAYAWFNVAASEGTPFHISLRDKIVKEMTPEQIGEGQKMAREFFEKYSTGKLIKQLGR